jgi:hypothetical protein
MVAGEGEGTCAGNTMNHTNYCRQILSQFNEIAKLPNIESGKIPVISRVINLCKCSQKFMLPGNGNLLPDLLLRALDDSVPLRLPYQLLALEFTKNMASKDGGIVAVKRVVFCWEEDHDDGYIYVMQAAYTVDGFWTVRREFRIQKSSYIDRSNPSNPIVYGQFNGGDSDGLGMKDVLVVLGFLNALSCSNVHIRTSPPKKSARIRKNKSALPFDEYHVLTISVHGEAGDREVLGGSHRSPREHLRRGHIRRLADGRRIWVNATVVAAGRGAGMIKKDYSLKWLKSA